MTNSKKIKIAVLLSGGGTTYQYIQDRIDADELDAEVVLAISSSEEAFGLQRAIKRGIPAETVSRKKFTEMNADDPIREFGLELIRRIEPYEADLIVLAGFMSFLSHEFIERFRDRIINTHPALIPAFCGSNFYGDRVHKAVVEKRRQSNRLHNTFRR